MVLTRRSASREPMLTAEEEARLIEAWQSRRDRAARDRIVRAYGRLCFSVAARYTSNPDQQEDLAQEGAMGLLKALDRFDPAKGASFSSYARLWIRNYVQVAVARVASVVDVPTRMFFDFRSGHMDGASEAFAATMPALSLDEPLGDSSLTVADALPSREPSPEEIISDGAASEYFSGVIAEVLDTLDSRGKAVVTRRVLADPPDTLERIAVDFGVTRERIRQIEMSALKKMRKVLEDRGFDPSLLD